MFTNTADRFICLNCDGPNSPFVVGFKSAWTDNPAWIYYDLLYVQHMSALVDLKIIVATILTLGGKWCAPLTWIISKGQLQPLPR